jgi:hypothetical protein
VAGLGVVKAALGGVAGGAQAEHVGAAPLKAPLVTSQARTTTAPQKPALQVQFQVPGTAVSCAVAVACSGGTQGEARAEPCGQYVPGAHALAVPVSAPAAHQKPAGQGVGAPAPAGQKLPAGHLICVALLEPAGQ